MADLDGVRAQLDKLPPWALPVGAGVAVGGVILLIRQTRGGAGTAEPAPAPVQAPTSGGSNERPPFEGQYVDQGAILQTAAQQSAAALAAYRSEDAAALAAYKTQAEQQLAAQQQQLQALLAQTSTDLTGRFGGIQSDFDQFRAANQAQAAQIASLQSSIAQLTALVNGLTNTRPPVEPTQPPPPTGTKPLPPDAALTAQDWRDFAANAGLLAGGVVATGRRYPVGSAITVDEGNTRKSRAVLYLPVAYNAAYDTWRGDFGNRPDSEPTFVRVCRWTADDMAANPARDPKKAFVDNVWRVSREIKADKRPLRDGGFDFWGLGITD